MPTAADAPVRFGRFAAFGRVVEGIEHLSSLPRGTGALGFYEKAEQRVPIVSIRLASEPRGEPGNDRLRSRRSGR